MTKRYEEREWNLPLPECSKCLNWDILKDSPLAIYPAPDKYPLVEQEERCRTYTIGSKQYLKPFRIDYPGLREAISFAHSKFIDGSWTKDNCKEYLRVEGINKELAEEVLLHAELALSKALRPDDEVEGEIREHRIPQPEQYKMMSSPPLWR